MNAGSRLRFGLWSLLGVAWSITLGGYAAEVAVLRGPYLQLATPESMVVVWRTNGATNPIVKVGPAPDRLTQTLSGAAITRRVSIADESAEASTPRLFRETPAAAAEQGFGHVNPSTPLGVHQYEAPIRGLSPGQEYYYAVYDGDRLLAGADQEHRFRTSPPLDAATNLRVWVVGDSGTGGVAQKRVHAAMQEFVHSSERPIDLYLHVGDMAYGDGADLEFQKNFFDVYQPTLRRIVCWPTMGNHEGHTSRGMSQIGPYYDAYVVPTAAEAGGVASGTEAYYSFNIAGVHFICLDSHDLDRTPSGAMAQWLQADLDATRSKWLVAFWHHPPYTKGSHDSDTEGQLVEMRTHIMPILESGGVDLVLAGHSHIYERSMLIDRAYATPTVAEGVVLDDGDGDPEGDGPYRKSAGLHPHEGTVAVVSGHGGAAVGRQGTMPIMRTVFVEHGSLILDFEDHQVTGAMINKEPVVRDRFRIVKQGQVQPQIVANPWRMVDDPSSYTNFVVAWDGAERGEPTAGWNITSGNPSDIEVTTRPGETIRQAEFRPQTEPLVALVARFDGRVSEVQTWLKFAAETKAAAGLVLGAAGPDDFLLFLINPVEQTATLSRVAAGVETQLGRRRIDVDFFAPIEIELEPVENILEVHINDEIEYTVELPAQVSAGQVGLRAEPGAVARFAGLEIEVETE